MAKVLVSGHGMTDLEVSEMCLNMEDLIGQIQRFRDCADEHESMFMSEDVNKADEAGALLLQVVEALKARGL